MLNWCTINSWTLIKLISDVSGKIADGIWVTQHDTSHIALLQSSEICNIPGAARMVLQTVLTNIYYVACWEKREKKRQKKVEDLNLLTLPSVDQPLLRCILDIFIVNIHRNNIRILIYKLISCLCAIYPGAMRRPRTKWKLWYFFLFSYYVDERLLSHINCLLNGKKHQIFWQIRHKSFT